MNAALNSKITVDVMSASYENMGYTLFQNDTRDYNFNMFGVRGAIADTNTFNDVIGLLWKYKGVWQLRTYAATTDPGKEYFVNPITPKGTHIMKGGQYRGAYAPGKHKGKYGALLQVGPIDFYEDNDRDVQFDRTKIVTGQYIGANIHSVINAVIPDLLTASMSYFPNVESALVNTWSAACQVHANPYRYLEFMKYVYAAVPIYGGKFTYTLFEEGEL